MKRDSLILTVVIVLVVGVLLGAWIRGCVQAKWKADQDKAVAAAQSKIDSAQVVLTAIDSTYLLTLKWGMEKVDSLKAKRLTALAAYVARYRYGVDSLTWERERITNDTLKMPERKP